MALDVWTKPSGYDFGLYPGVGKVILTDEIQVGEKYFIVSLGNTDFTKLGASQNTVGTVFVAKQVGDITDTGTVAETVLDERTTVNILLPINSTTGVTFKVISGALPRGLRISGHSIVGTPFEVPRRTEYKFVIRASKNGEISDRTFQITITGSDEPVWLTQPGVLPIGSNNAYYVIDSGFIDFQLSAIDSDTAAGQDLNFFIASGEGELPPGLILLPNGRITGFIQPLLAVLRNTDQGHYDSGSFDSAGYDFGVRPSNGFDSFVYDEVTYDFNVETLRPRKLNRNYEFIATITDGDTVSKRKFRIYVVGDDFFRADNVIMQAGDGAYTADITYLQSPIFTTPKYLGLKRANNYQTFKIDIYTGQYNELGTVFYELAAANAMVNAVVRRDLPSDNRSGGRTIRIERATSTPQIGYIINFNRDFTGATPKTYTIKDVDPIGGDIYRITLDDLDKLDTDIPDGTPFYAGTNSVLPPGMEFDTVTGEIFGNIPYMPAVTKRYTFTIKATRYGQGSETATSRRMFNVDVLGEVDSTMSWNTPTELGSIEVGYPSSLFVNANTTLTNSIILYYLDGGNLPPGLSLNLDGEIVGKVNQIRDQNRYRSFWKPSTKYKIKDVIKQETLVAVKSVLRRKNIATAVTTRHPFKTGDIVKLSTSQLSFNYYNGIEVFLDKFKLESASVIPISTTGKYAVTFTIPTQPYAPLAFSYTKVTGTASTTFDFDYSDIEVKTTSGTGSGARFRLEKSSGNDSYSIGTVSITLLEPGVGYKPGDIVVISGADLGGEDIVNDLTFTILSGTEFLYKVNGNSNRNYNGEFLAIKSTTNTITLLYNSDPLAFGSGLISTEISPGDYEAQTQLVPLNYFSYRNSNQSQEMIPVTGTAIGDPEFYRCKKEHVSNADIVSLAIDEHWELYNFPEVESSLTTLDRTNTTFDGNLTNLDRKFTFTITAKDALGYSAITRTFNLTVSVPNNTYYSNLTAKPMMKLDIRQKFKDFINNSNIFDPKYIYRLADPNFGVQRNLTSLIYAGVETKTAEEYISVMGMNHKSKRFNIGDIKKAVAKVPGTNTVVYEVIYLELKDPLEKNGKHLPFKVIHKPGSFPITADNTNDFYKGASTDDNPHWKRPIPLTASIDRTDIIAGDSGTGVKFPSSISIWRKRIRAMPDTLRERNFLPLWMRSIQPGSVEELDFTLAVPLCYCTPGTADEILLNIKNSGFDFKMLDYTVDRFIIDSVEGYFADKYLIFKNDRTTII